MKVGDAVRIVQDAWPAPGYDAGYMGDVLINGRPIGPGDVHLVERLLPPRWFEHRKMHVAEIRNMPGRDPVFVTEAISVVITFNLKLLEREVEVVPG